MMSLGRYAAYLYLLRVPLFIWLFLILFPLVAVPKNAPFRPFLKGIFDVSGAPPSAALGFFLVTIAAFMTATAVSITARLILLDGHERFGVEPVQENRGVRFATGVASFLAPIFILAGVYWQTRGIVPWLAMAAAIGAGLVVLFFGIRWLESRFLAARTSLEPGGQSRKLLKPFRWWMRRSPAGFVDPATNQIRGQHAFAVFQFSISLALYVALFVGKKYFFQGHQPAYVPTLCVVLILAMLLCWMLSGVTFFFDRFRIPLLLIVVAWSGLMSLFPQADTFYASIGPVPTAPDLPPNNVLATRAGKPVIVVAATGGGIQSAAWAARVLSGLQQRLAPKGLDFDQSIRLISSVSGGSAGALFILDAYDQNGKLPRAEGELDDYKPLKLAEASSLDEVAWGLVYPDLVWSFFPPLKAFNLTSGRGEALENSWKRTDGLKKATLSDWRQVAASGRKPALIFNSTIVETGQRLLLSTTDMDSPCPLPGAPSSVGRQEFRCLYQKQDLQVVTAARLSSTFPYVSPAARIYRGDVFAKEYHAVDGGYYDDFGVSTLVEWLDQALLAPGPKPSRVLVLEIRGFPTGDVAAPKGRRGWLFQFGAPLQALLGVRKTAQLSHNNFLLRFAEHETRYGIPVTNAIFEFRSIDDNGKLAKVPESWHLTAEDKRNLHNQWKAQPDSEIKKVEAFLHP